MTPVCRPLSSVTRWLLMVVGCAVLETAQPMMAQTDETATEAPPRTDETMIYPTGVEKAPEVGADSPRASSRGGWLFAALVGFGGAGLW